MQLRPDDQSVLHLMHAAVSDATGDAPDEDESDSPPALQKVQQLEQGDTPPAVEDAPTEPDSKLEVYHMYVRILSVYVQSGLVVARDVKYAWMV
jgi:hypothetical protein